MLLNKKIGVISVFILILVVMSSSVLAARFQEAYLCENCSSTCDVVMSCNQSSNPCVVSEKSTFEICSAIRNDIWSWDQLNYDSTPPPYVSGLSPYYTRNSFNYIVASVPLLEEEANVYIKIERVNSVDAYAYIKILNDIPTKHYCYDINTSNCADDLYFENLMVFFSLVENIARDVQIGHFEPAPWGYFEAQEILEVVGYGPLVVGADFSNPGVVISEDNATLPTTTAGVVSVDGGPVYINGSIWSVDGSGVIVDDALAIKGNLTGSGDLIEIGSNVIMNQGLEVVGASDLGRVPLMENVVSARYYFSHVQTTSGGYPYCYGDGNPWAWNCGTASGLACCQYDFTMVGDGCMDGSDAYFTPNTNDHPQDLSSEYCRDYVSGNVNRYFIFKREYVFDDTFMNANITIINNMTAEQAIILDDEARYTWPDSQSIGIENLVYNTGFEISTDHWSAYGDAATTIGMSGESYDGSYSALVNVPSGTGFSGMRAYDPEKFDVKPDTVYVVSAMVKTNAISGGNHDVTFTTHCHDVGHDGNNQHSTTLEPDDEDMLIQNSDWTKLMRIVETSADADHCHVLVYLNPGEIGSFYVDSVQAEESREMATFKPRTLLMNGDAGFKMMQIRSNLVATGSVTAGGMDVGFLVAYNVIIQDGLNIGLGNIDVTGNVMIENFMKADKFLGPVNLEVTCDARALKLRDQDGFAMIRGGTGLCGLGDPCSVGTECSSGTCNNYRCITGGAS